MPGVQRLAQLLDAQQVAGGVAEGAVADAVWLVGRLLDDLGAAGLDLLEGGVDIGAGGIEKIVQVELNAAEKAAFEQSCGAVRELVEAAKKLIG